MPARDRRWCRAGGVGRSAPRVRTVIRAERDGHVTRVVIDRPERRNALDAEALEALAAAAESASGDGTRVLVLAGAGGHFCAGADLGSVDGPGYATLLRRVLDLLTGAPYVALAAISGAALGAGLQLALACDLRHATPDARLGIPAARLGLMVDHETVRRLSALAGESTARAVLLAAEDLTGTEAHRIGLVNRLGTAEQAVAWAEEIARLAPLSIRGHKLMLARLGRPPEPDDEVAAAWRAAWESADLREGRRAFAEKRPPRFEGR